MMSSENPGSLASGVPGMVRQQAGRRPNDLALAEPGRTLTYRQLDEHATRVANRLQALGVGPEVLVGLCLPGSLAMVVGALGILKAGGAYLPLDPAQPDERLRAIVR